MNTFHGGNVYKASETTGIGIDEILDFSANINPLGMPDKLKQELIKGIELLKHYPDPEYGRLRRYITEYTGVPGDMIVPGNGCAEIIMMLPGAINPDSILIPVPSFSLYEKAAICAGINPRFLKLKEENEFSIIPDQLADEFGKGIDCVFLCNPNNPTSKLIPKDEMTYIIKKAAEHGTIVIIDEAFIELTDGGIKNSISGLVQKYDNLFVIRACTKILALPGLRFGYGLGNRSLVEYMMKTKQPWPVNTLSECAAGFLCDADDFFRKTGEWLNAEKEKLYVGLKKIKDLKVYKPDSNFLLAKITDTSVRSEDLSKVLEKRGILIRNAETFRSLDESYFRVAVKSGKDNDRLIHEIYEFFKNRVGAGGENAYT